MGLLRHSTAARIITPRAGAPSAWEMPRMTSLLIYIRCQSATPAAVRAVHWPYRYVLATTIRKESKGQNSTLVVKISYPTYVAKHSPELAVLLLATMSALSETVGQYSTNIAPTQHTCTGSVAEVGSEKLKSQPCIMPTHLLKEDKSDGRVERTSKPEGIIPMAQ